jgi:hypothetical protein
MSETDLLLSQLDRMKSRLVTIKNESIKTRELILKLAMRIL